MFYLRSWWMTPIMLQPSVSINLDEFVRNFRLDQKRSMVKKIYKFSLPKRGQNLYFLFLWPSVKAEDLPPVWKFGHRLFYIYCTDIRIYALPTEFHSVMCRNREKREILCGYFGLKYPQDFHIHCKKYLTISLLNEKCILFHYGIFA